MSESYRKWFGINSVNTIEYQIKFSSDLSDKKSEVMNSFNQILEQIYGNLIWVKLKKWLNGLIFQT